MAKGTGSAAVLQVDNAIGMAGATAVGNLVSFDMSRSMNAVDVTDNDSAGDKEYLAGDRDGTVSITCRYETGDGGQDELIAAFNSSSSVVFLRYFPQGVSVAEHYTFQVYLTGMSVPSEHEATVDITFDGQMTGALTYVSV